MLDHVPMQDRDTNGDLYEYLLSNFASAGVNGQFRTPRHIIQLMVEMTAPGPKDQICDPACGTAGFLVAAGEYVRRAHPSVLVDADQRQHFHHSMFHGFDFDSTMLRIGSMNMLLHGVENPDIATPCRRASAATVHLAGDGATSGPHPPPQGRQVAQAWWGATVSTSTRAGGCQVGRA